MTDVNRSWERFYSMDQREKSLLEARLIMQRLNNLMQPERIESLRNAFSNANNDQTQEETRLSTMEGILYNSDNKGSAIDLPLSSNPETFDEQLSEHRYLFRETGTGVIRVRMDLIEKDWEKFENEPPLFTEADKVFRSFLEEMRQVDLISFARTIAIPDVIHSTESGTVSEAKGAVRALTMLTFAGLGTASVLMEKGGVPIIGLSYLGLAGIIYNPTILTDGPVEKIKDELGFIVSTGNQNDLWSECMNGTYSQELAGSNGFSAFEQLLDSDFQRVNSQRINNRITNEEYYEELEELGMRSSLVSTIRDMETRRPDLFRYLISNTSRVRGSDSKETLMNYARERMSSSTIVDMYANNSPQTAPRPNLGGIGEARLGLNS